MGQVKYLYGAAVQGIQNFIFQTNELKDIVGASELVETICKSEFANYTNGKDSILRAAGNIKHVFDSAEECMKVVREFPKRVMEIAPGITISQAVVKLDGDNLDFSKAVDLLEQRLRTQRNKPAASTTVGIMGIKRSNKTGYPAVQIKKDDYLDAATCAKRSYTDYHVLSDKIFGKGLPPKDFAFNLQDMTSKNDWIAIIHADGNGLGQIVQKVGKNPEEFREFSERLSDCTIKAAQSAWQEAQGIIGNCKPMPLRPVVLGGDDLTVICRADFAVEFVSSFLHFFEMETEVQLGKILEKNRVFENGANKLTACAGIAFIKSSYPFYYGYDLAESLCGQAKKHAKSIDKELAPSCLMFHKVQDSFVEDFAKIEKRELTPCIGVSFKHGPYYLHDKYGTATVDHLLTSISLLDSEEGNKIKSHIRQWITSLYTDMEVATQKHNRVISLLTDGPLKELFTDVTNYNAGSSMAYDMLALSSIKFLDTKSQEE